jgi:hypothetical protein
MLLLLFGIRRRHQAAFFLSSPSPSWWTSAAARVLFALLLLLLFFFSRAAWCAQEEQQQQQHAPATAEVAASAGDVRLVKRSVLARADHGGRVFAIVDKKDAHIYVFDASGSLIGASPVLLGLAIGDRDAVPHIGDRMPVSLAPDERTTPAGRFESEPGRNGKGEPIVWIDYDAALAIHRLRPAPAHERRAQRMASADPAERRISFGCVVVPVAFYEQTIAPTLGSRRGVVYVLPETGNVTVESLLLQRGTQQQQQQQQQQQRQALDDADSDDDSSGATTSQ